jgi:hypothetical protein
MVSRDGPQVTEGFPFFEKCSNPDNAVLRLARRPATEFDLSKIAANFFGALGVPPSAGQ